MKIEVIIAIVTLLSMKNSSAIWLEAGATIDDETGDMKVKHDTIVTAIHFRRPLQLVNARGKSEPYNVDTPYDSLLRVCGICWAIPVHNHLIHRILALDTRTSAQPLLSDMILGVIIHRTSFYLTFLDILGQRVRLGCHNVRISCRV